jgi:predicted nucleic acid-binding protein
MIYVKSESMNLVPNSSVVIDAKLAVYSTVGSPAEIQSQVDSFWQQSQAGVVLYAPFLWVSETTSVIRFLDKNELLKQDDVLNALDILTAVNVRLVPETSLRSKAYEWAERLGQARAYDAFYLALAEDNDLVLWTADARLVNRARQLKIDWVKWVGDVA